MSLRIPKLLVWLLITATLIVPNFQGFAQEEGAEEEVGASSSGDPAQERQALEEELQKLEDEIAGYEKDISKTQAEKKTLQNKIYILQSQIKKLDLQIKQNNVLIKDVGVQITDTTISINKTTSKIGESRQKLVDILRLVYEEDQKSLLEVLLSEDKLSAFFDNLVALEALLSKNQELLEDIKQLKVSLEDQKQSLDSEKDDLERLLEIQRLQKAEGQTVKKEQETLLEETKGKESEYQKMLVQSKEKAAQIRSRIFELIGIAKTPTFGEAYEIAKFVSHATGIRPALLLAVMTQESNIGKNVGQCYLPQDQQENKKKRIMAPGPPDSKRDDVSFFLDVTKELGRNPYNTPVSCPMEYGWGGAMGPAQFIPTTWVVYKERVRTITDKSTADPWDINDAFAAAALYLSDYGAKAKTYNGEWKAAMIYFSGSTNTKYRFYGDSVMNIAKQYEQDIKALEQ